MKKQSLRTIKKFNKLSKLVFLFTVIIMSISVLILCTPSQNHERMSHQYSDFSSGWVTQDNEPANLLHINGHYRISNTIPELSKDCTLFFFAKTINVRIYIDDKLIYEPKHYTTRLFGKTPGAAFIHTHLTVSDSNRTITLDIDNPYNDGSGKISSMLLGDGRDIITSQIRQRLPAFCISLVISVLGICFILLFPPLYSQKIIGTEMLYLGLFATIVGLFMIMDCRIMQLFFENAHIFHMQAEILMPLIIAPLFLFMGKMYKELSSRIINTMTILSCTALLVCFLLTMFRIKDFHETIYVTHLLYAISILIVIYAITAEIFKHHKHSIYHNIGCIGFCIAVSIDLLLHWFKLSVETSFFTRIGVLLFLCMEALQIVNYLLSNYQANIKNKLLSRLAYHDGLTDMLNRTSYMEQIKSLDTLDYSELLIAIFDVNNLKYVNDTYGHAKGDQLIKSVADTLQDTLSFFGKCYRIGGDEFVFISTEPDAENTFINTSSKLLSSYGNLPIDDESELPITVAMGYSIFHKDMKRSIDDVIREADSNMYENKRMQKEGKQH